MSYNRADLLAEVKRWHNLGIPSIDENGKETTRQWRALELKIRKQHKDGGSSEEPLATFGVRTDTNDEELVNDIEKVISRIGGTLEGENEFPLYCYFKGSNANQYEGYFPIEWRSPIRVNHGSHINWDQQGARQKSQAKDEHAFAGLAINAGSINIKALQDTIDDLRGQLKDERGETSRLRGELRDANNIVKEALDFKQEREFKAQDKQFWQFAKKVGLMKFISLVPIGIWYLTRGKTEQIKPMTESEYKELFTGVMNDIKAGGGNLAEVMQKLKLTQPTAQKLLSLAEGLADEGMKNTIEREAKNSNGLFQQMLQQMMQEEGNPLAGMMGNEPAPTE